MHLPIEGSSVRTHVVVNRKHPKLGAAGKQEELVTDVRVPVLIIHGDTGDQEPELAAVTARGEHLLPAGSRVVVIPGESHRSCRDDAEPAPGCQYPSFAIGNKAMMRPPERPRR